MKNKQVHILIIFILYLTLLSYKNNTNTNTTEPMDKTNKTTETPNNVPYDPGKGWVLDWADEFDTKTLNKANWSRQVEKAGRFNQEWQRYTNSKKNAYIENNCLVIKAIHKGNKHGHNQYTSARLHTANKQAWKYGKIAARIKLPKGKGIWPAFWMLGANIDENGGDTPWPQSGEIDILELYGTKDDAVVECNIHYADKNNVHANMGAVAYKLKEGIFADEFHIFELEWDENTLTWLVDGEAYATTKINTSERNEFHHKFFLLLNIAVGGTYAGWPDETTVFPQYMYVDWIRVYKKQP